MTANTVSQWNVFCLTESTFVSGFSTTTPNACFHDVTHKINPNNIQQLAYYSNFQPIFQHSVLEAIPFSVSASGTAEYSVVRPFQSASNDIVINASNNNVGDAVSVAVNYKTPTGSLTANIPSGATSLTLTNTSGLIVNINIGLTVGTVFTDLGKITAINGNTVSFQTATTQAFNASHTTVSSTQYLVKHLDITESGMIETGVFYNLAANQPLTIIYHNSTHTATNVLAMVRYSF